MSLKQVWSTQQVPAGGQPLALLKQLKRRTNECPLVVYMLVGENRRFMGKMCSVSGEKGKQPGGQHGFRKQKQGWSSILASNLTKFRASYEIRL